MQYILTQEEMDVKRQLLTDVSRLPSPDKLQKFCTMIANSLPVTKGWYKGKTWGCILTTEQEWYCDDCPAREVCPNPNKQWSK